MFDLLDSVYDLFARIIDVDFVVIPTCGDNEHRFIDGRVYNEPAVFLIVVSQICPASCETYSQGCLC